MPPNGKAMVTPVSESRVAPHIDVNSNFTLDPGQSGSTLNTVFATATRTVTLPDAIAENVGTWYRFVAYSGAWGLVIKPGSGATITLNNSTVTSSGGALTFAAPTAGSALRIELIAPNVWQVTSSQGTQPTAS